MLATLSFAGLTCPSPMLAPSGAELSGSHQEPGHQFFWQLQGLWPREVHVLCLFIVRWLVIPEVRRISPWDITKSRP